MAYLIIKDMSILSSSGISLPLDLRKAMLLFVIAQTTCLMLLKLASSFVLGAFI